MKFAVVTRLLCAVLPLLLLAGTADRAVAKDETEWYDDGMGLLGEKKLAEAEAAFREAIKVDPRYKQAWQALADMLKAEGKTDRAVLAQKMADEAPAARDGDPPPLTDEQKQALGEGVAPPATPAQPAATAPAQPAATAAAAEPLRPLPALSARDAAGKPKRLVKLSQYNEGQYCDLAVGPSGSFHAIFTDRPEHGKSAYLYYRSSGNGGATWSDTQNLSDDESGNDASYGRVVIDGQSRVYAIWKYIPKDQLLDGPGGNKEGYLVYRCWSGGTWSRRVKLTDPKVPAYSWFPALAPDGSVQVVWSQIAPDGMRAMGWSTSQYGNLVQQVALDGATPGAAKAVITPPALPTKEQVDAAQAAGHPIPHDQQQPRKNGFINLRGGIDAAGVMHFVAEDPGVADGGSDVQTGRRIVYWDGAKLHELYMFEKYKTYNTFDNPPALLMDSHGKEHLIRSPEKSEKACVRDYAIEGGELGDPLDIVAAADGKGAISAWQAMQLPGGRMVVAVALSAKGGYRPDDTELYVAFSAGGEWSKPLCVTDNKARQSISAREVRGAAAAAVQKTYTPVMAAVVLGRDGHPGVLMVNNESTLAGITGVAANGGLGVISARTDEPMVFFMRL